MASFPGAVKTFTTRNAGDTIQPSHVNDLQDEVNAIEDGYRNATAPLNSSKSTVATLDVVGVSTLHGAVTIGGDVTMASSLQISGELKVTGNSSLTGALNVSGASSFGGNAIFMNTATFSSQAVFAEISTIAAAGANTARLYARDNGAGKTELVVIFQSGAGQVLATEP
jgi:hypothetical protein